VIRAFGPESTPAPVEGPIKRPEDLKTYTLPDPEADDVPGTIPAIVARYKGKKAITALGRDAFFNPAFLRGISQFLMDMIENPEVVKHTDGNIMPILDMIVDTGIDGLNPIEPAAGMDIGVLKQCHGHRIALIGNIDCGYLLSQAPTEKVRRVTQDTIRVAAPGGGFCLSNSNSIHSSVKAENFMAMIETWRECPAYPTVAG
jgi:hypothetical protein